MLKLKAFSQHYKKIFSLNMNLSKAYYWYDESEDYNNTNNPLGSGADLARGTVTVFLVCADEDSNVAGFQIVQFKPRADGTAMFIYSFDAKGKFQNVKSKVFKSVAQARAVFVRGYSDITKWGPEDGQISLRLIHSVELSDIAKQFISKGIKLTKEDLKPIKVAKIDVPAQYR